jgi:signal transduction histidine kinase/tetratricopeptide (TPR) repeat protein
MGNDIAIASLQEKIDDLNQRAWEARVNDSPKSFELSQESVKLARSINYAKGLAEGLRSLGLGYVRFFKNDEAAPLLRESLSLFQSLNDLKGQGIIYEYLGIIERNSGNLGSSLELLLKGNDLVRQTGPLEVEVTSCYQIGVTYKHLGKHENALDYLYRSISLSKKINFTLMEAYATNIIGSIYFDNGDYNHALDCYQQSLVIRQQSHDKWGEAGSLDNIGFTYLKLNDLDKAIDYCKQSLQITQGTDDKKGEANTLLHLAEIYQRAGDIGQASKFSNESLEIRKARSDKRGEAEALLFLANLHKHENDGKDHQVFGWLSDAWKIAGEIKAQDLLSKACYNLHEYHTQKGNYKESLVQLEAHLQIEKELHKNTINQKISNLEISHKAETISQRNKELTELNEQIEKANEELKIERSLERVRTAAMAMKEPVDMLEVCKIISDQLEILDVKKIRNVQTAIFYEEKSSYMNYEYYAKHDKLLITEVDYNNHPVAEKFANQMLKGPNQVWTHGFKGEEVKDWLNYQRSTNVFIDTYLETADSLNYYWYSLGPVALGMSTYVPLNENEIDLFKRFRNVFELAYRRYLDIEKAQAQAREAQIETGMERVRSKTMAMHKSEEVTGVAVSLNEELLKLGFEGGSTIIIMNKETGDMEQWTGFSEDKSLKSCIVPYFKHPCHDAQLNAWKKGEKFLVYTVTGEEKKTLDDHYFETGYKDFPESDKTWMRDMESVTFSHAFMKYGAIHWGPNNLTEEQLGILQRFSKVFEQSYTRFLDLQKAEAQARESQIQLALERVRARTMAMQHSNELQETAVLLFQQVKSLDILTGSCSFNIWDADEPSATVWSSSVEGNLQAPFKLSHAESPIYRDVYASMKRGDEILVKKVGGEELKKHFAYLTTVPVINDVINKLRKSGYLFPENIIYHFAFFKQGYLSFHVHELQPEAKKVFVRFAKVFEQTYTRFLDLQKAEAQAREARIETALEKVRASTMAMQRSEDLSQTAFVLFNQFKELGQAPERIFIATFDDHDKGIVDLWGTDQGGKQLNKLFKVPVNEPTMVSKIVAAWKDKKRSVVIDLKDEELKTYLGFLKQAGIPVTEGIMTDRRVQTAACFSNGVIGVTTSEPQSAEAVQLQERFAGVFDLTYTRFLDLQKAEAQTREALIEGALERVRARALAMQQPEELKDVAQVLRNEMGALGVEELETCSIYIHGDSSDNVECWYALQDPKHAEKKMVSDHFVLNLDDTWVGREMKKFYGSGKDQTSIVMQGMYRKEWIKYCYEHSPVFSGFYGESIPDRTYHLHKFSHGYIGAAAPGDISGESWKLLGRAASVFSLAYSRFKDLTQARNDLIKLKEEKKRAEDALTELQATQKQLIQSEKMASLGELTAGIAHEIQNPLNFVNNFSDVSNELLEEMKAELEKGNAEGAKAIAVDVKENLEKILHHGKRADAIVKGMLQHSRSSSGQKELTDINTLAEEYLRLAYHGLRAKDKFFNAKFETDLDRSITKINIIPQEIGRVILNLINNSFYAVTEKKRSVSNGYEPSVIVSTKKINGKVEIRVMDNGNGIPKKVLDKIFQPFFTTKPTGEGTGLGLSLSYDIITKGHDGEIKVETKEGEGSAFIISLPMK